MPSFFPLWMVVTRFLNIFFMLLLARSGREWLRFSEKTVGADSRPPWSSLDEEEAWSPLVALPGRKNLGLGRHWHGDIPFGPGPVSTLREPFRRQAGSRAGPQP